MTHPVRRHSTRRYRRFQRDTPLPSGANQSPRSSHVPPTADARRHPLSLRLLHHRCGARWPYRGDRHGLQRRRHGDQRHHRSRHLQRLGRYLYRHGDRHLRRHLDRARPSRRPLHPEQRLREWRLPQLRRHRPPLRRPLHLRRQLRRRLGLPPARRRRHLLPVHRLHRELQRRRRRLRPPGRRRSQRRTWLHRPRTVLRRRLPLRRCAALLRKPLHRPEQRPHQLR